MATPEWDRVPIFGWYYAAPLAPIAGTITITITGAPDGVKRVDGRGIYRAGASRTITLGNAADREPEVVEAVRVAMRARDAAKAAEAGVTFSGSAWDAAWTAALPAMVATSFYAQDDEDVTPKDWQIQVTERIGSSNVTPRTYPIELRISMRDTSPERPIPGLNLADVEIPPGKPATPAPTYAKGQPGGVAPLDSGARVPVEYLPDGIGSGSVSSVNGSTGAVELTAAALGAVADDDDRLSDVRDTTRARITDAGDTGRAVLAATTPAEGRSAIGAGTSNLTTGTTSTTAAAGNDPRLSDTRTPSANSVTNGSVADGALSQAKVNGLTTALGLLVLSSQLANTNLTYSAAAALSSRPTVPTGTSVRIYGATRAQAEAGFSWMVAGDYFDGITT